LVKSGFSATFSVWTAGGVAAGRVAAACSWAIIA
jgi:hypothetical protein